MFPDPLTTILVPRNHHETAGPTVGRQRHAHIQHTHGGCADLTLGLFLVFWLPKLMFIDILGHYGLYLDVRA